MLVKSVLFQCLIFKQSASKQDDFTDDDHFHVVDLRPPAILPEPWESPSAGRK